MPERPPTDDGEDAPAALALNEPVDVVGEVPAGVYAGAGDAELRAVMFRPSPHEEVIEGAPYFACARRAVKHAVLNAPGLVVGAPAEDFEFEAVILDVDAAGQELDAFRK